MVSVAMASYNGEEYIQTQIESILRNLKPDDELVISDDGSTDKTWQIIQRFQDKRIHLIDGPREGINRNFQNAIRHCHGDYIFLSDQDDIWFPNKVERVLRQFDETDYLLVQHDAIVVNERREELCASYFADRRVKRGLVRNWLRNSYHGCCMAFRKSIKDYIIPIPTRGCFHDQWIGLISEYYGKTCFLPEKLIEYRRHEGNASSIRHLPFHVQLYNRYKLASNFIAFLKRNAGRRIVS